MPKTLPKTEYEIIETVIGFVVVDGLILCLKRDDEDRFHPGKWCFPSGKIEEGESAIDALFREVRREVGLYETTNVSFIGKYKAWLKKRKRMFKISTYQLYYQFPVQFQLSDKYGELRLCTPEEVQELDLAGNVSKGILKEYLKRIGYESEEG